MSIILLEDAKRFLRMTHDDDDAAIQDALDAAEDEALRYMNRDYLPMVNAEVISEGVSEDNPVSDGETPTEAGAEVSPAVRMAVFLLTKANYDGANPDGFRGLLDLPAYRERAENLLVPYRTGLGI